MIEILLISKIVVSVVSVVGLSLIAEHFSSRVAGILAGYPLGTAISLFYIGLEQGKEFAGEGALFTLATFSVSIVMFYVYQRAAERILSNTIIISSAIAIGTFMILASLLSILPINLFSALAITIFSIFFFGRRLRHLANVTVKKRIKITHNVLFVRALSAAALVIIITGLADMIGPHWSGILSAFPITAFPFMLIMHYSYGVEQVNTIAKNYPYGLGALVVYVVTVMFSYPVIGIVLGTILSFATATVYLVSFIFLTSAQVKHWRS